MPTVSSLQKNQSVLFNLIIDLFNGLTALTRNEYSGDYRENMSLLLDGKRLVGFGYGIYHSITK